jgi:hypothetical protein
VKLKSISSSAPSDGLPALGDYRISSISSARAAGAAHLTTKDAKITKAPCQPLRRRPPKPLGDLGVLGGRHAQDSRLRGISGSPSA